VQRGKGELRRVGERRTFVATAEALDDEMRARIDGHRTERGDSFRRTKSTARTVAHPLGGTFFANDVARDAPLKGVRDPVWADSRMQEQTNVRPSIFSNATH
jgi:hypothetical protein